MTDHSKRGILVIAVLLICAVLLVGCNGGKARSPEGDNTKVVSSADKRAGLLNELDRKFENPDVHFELGQSYRGDGLWTQAQYHYSSALGFDPAHRGTQAALTKLLLDSGNEAKAIAYAERYIRQVSSSWKETLKLGNAFRDEQVDKLALACYQQALGLSPESAEIYRDVGYYFLSKNDKDVAKEYFKQSFRLDPRQAEVAGELGRLGVEVRMPRKVENQTEKPG